MSDIRKIHHVGWVVRDIHVAIPAVLALIGRESVVHEIVRDLEREVLVCFIEGHYTFELIQPDTETSPVRDLLSRSGATTYHVCIEVDSIDRELERLTEQGGIIVTEKSPAPAIQNRNVAFIFDKHLGLIELLE